MHVSDLLGWGTIALIGACAVWAAAMPIIVTRDLASGRVVIDLR